MKSSRHILCFDLGTTNVKAALINEEGSTLVVARVPLPSKQAQLGRSEMSAEAFECVIASLADQIANGSKSGLKDTCAVTFATQANSFLLLDRHDEPLTPIILWPDARARNDDEPINRISQMPSITGMPKLDYEFMPAKLRWLRKHAPKTWRKVHRICSIGDYLAICLSGEHVTEAGSAAMTGLVNARALQWWGPALETVETPLHWLPRVVRAGTDVGSIRPAAAERLGLPPNVRVIIGCLDQYAAAIGTGGLQGQRFTETTGTVLSSVCVAREWDDDPPAGVFQGPSFDAEHFFRMAFSSTAGNLLEWYCRQLPDPVDLERLNQLAAQEPAGARGLVIEPLEESALIDRCFVNVQTSHTPGQVVRAIMERVARTLVELRRSMGIGLTAEVWSAGGGAQSDVWLQIKADVLGTHVIASLSPEPTSLGAAMLAAQSLGWGLLSDLSRDWCRPRKVFQPCRLADIEIQSSGPFHSSRSN